MAAMYRIFGVGVFVITLCVAVPVFAASDGSTLLRPPAIESGYTLEHPNGTFRVGVQPGTIQQVKRTRLTVNKITKPERFFTEQDVAIGDLYRYKIGNGKAKRVRLSKKLLITLSYPESYTSKEKVIKYWSAKTQSWKRLKTKDDSDAHIVMASLKHKTAVVGVFEIPKETTGDIVQGVASWYDGVGCACNDFPMGTTVRVTNTNNSSTVDCTISSKGPFVPGRVIDLRREDFSAIADLGTGVINVEVQAVE